MVTFHLLVTEVLLLLQPSLAYLLYRSLIGPAIKNVTIIITNYYYWYTINYYIHCI